jgi:hypothetical protein
MLWHEHTPDQRRAAIIDMIWTIIIALGFPLGIWLAMLATN